MRKSVLLGVTAVIMCFLTACQCSHEWIAADCITEKSCVKCNVTEGEPLGHSWQEASCTAPKTCSICNQTEGVAIGHSWTEATCAAASTCQICGATEGESLPHAMGNWNVDGETMSRSCQSCLETETTEYDEERFLSDLVCGTWNQSVTTIYHPTKLEYSLTANSDYQLTLLEDRTFTGYLGYSLQGTWSVKEISQADGKTVCSLVLDCSEMEESKPGKHLELVVEDAVASVADTEKKSTHVYAFRRQDGKLRAEEEFLVGHWTMLMVESFVPGGKANRQFASECSLTLNSDGTLTASFGGERTGRWVFHESYTGKGDLMETWSYAVQFDGDDEAFSMDLKEKESLCISEDGGKVVRNQWFGKLSQEESELFQSAGNILPGTWQAVSAIRQNPETDAFDLQTDPGDFSMTFREDGTFTMNVENVEGTWEQYPYRYFKDSGCMVMLGYNDTYNSCTLALDRTLSFWQDIDGELICLTLEKK